MDAAVDDVMGLLAGQPPDRCFDVALLDREHGGGVLAVGIPMGDATLDGQVIADVYEVMTRHFTSVAASEGSSGDLPSAAD